MSYTVKLKDNFKSLFEYQDWVQNQLENISEINRGELTRFTKEAADLEIMFSPDWFGEGTTYKQLAEGVKEYRNPRLLDDLYNKVQHQLTANVSQKLKARRMKFNNMGFGMFCFDRAAMTMYRNEQFFKPSDGQILDNTQVKKVGNNYQDKADGGRVVKRWEKTREGKDKIRTNTKDLFAYFPEVSRDRHAVEFFVSPQAAAHVSADKMLYCGVSAVVMAELLIKAGIKVKINLVLGTSPQKSRQSYIGCVVPVKQYDETLDRNLIALLTSDPRFMRWDAFKGLVAALDHFKTKVPLGLGYPVNASQLRTLLEESGYTKNSKATHRYYFGGTFSEQAALDDISQTITDISTFLGK